MGEIIGCGLLHQLQMFNFNKLCLQWFKIAMVLLNIWKPHMHFSTQCLVGKGVIPLVSTNVNALGQVVCLSISFCFYVFFESKYQIQAHEYHTLIKCLAFNLIQLCSSRASTWSLPEFLSQPQHACTVDCENSQVKFLNIKSRPLTFTVITHNEKCYSFWIIGHIWHLQSYYRVKML